MFLEFFNWFCNCLSSIFNTMKEFELFTGFTYYNLFIALLAIPIFIKIFNFIMGIEDEEVNYGQPETNGNYMPQYDGYTPKHFNTYRAKHGIYQPKHQKKKRGWF